MFRKVIKLNVALKLTYIDTYVQTQRRITPKSFDASQNGIFMYLIKCNPLLFPSRCAGSK